MAEVFDPEESPYPQEVVAKLTEAKIAYDQVKAFRAGERIAYDHLRSLCVWLRRNGVGMKTLSKVLDTHPSNIQRITKGWDSPETGN